MPTINEVLASMREHEDAPEWLDAAISDAEGAANDFIAGYNAETKSFVEKVSAKDGEIERLRAENYRLMTNGTFDGKAKSAEPENDVTAQIEGLASKGFSFFEKKK